MKIALACDHGAYLYKEVLKKHLIALGHDIEDFGCFSEESVDYVDFAYPAAMSVAEGKNEKGIVMCGTGIGVSITANKVHGIRCALVNDTTVAKITREHNDSNILAMGARVIDENTMLKIADIWLDTSFSHDERHQRRIEKLSNIEG